MAKLLDRHTIEIFSITGAHVIEAAAQGETFHRQGGEAAGQGHGPWRTRGWASLQARLHGWANPSARGFR